MRSFAQDIRYGIRMLAKSPGFTTVAILTLALGIGANTAIFSIVDGIWLRPLPIQDPRGLVRISNIQADKPDRGNNSSYPEYLDYRSQTAALSDVAAVMHRGVLLKTADETKQLYANVVSPNYFSMLGVRTAIGRTFSEQELSVSDPAPVVLLSHSAWQKYFGGDPRALDTPVNLNGMLCAVVGVLAPGVHGTDTTFDVDVWIPVSTWTRGGRDSLQRREDRQFEVFARLHRGQNLQQAQAQLGAISAWLAQTYPKSDTRRSVTAEFEHRTRSSGVRMLSLLLLAISTLVLLIACANLSNVLMARSESRCKEFATRLALGASRTRLIRQLFTEGFLLSLAGSLGAIALATWLVRVLIALAPPELPILLDFRMDVRVLSFTAGVAIISVLLSGTLPALRGVKVAPMVEMKEFGTSERDRRWGLRNLAVIGQVAASIILLIAAGLLLRTVIHLQAVNPGFDRDRQMLLVQLVPPYGGERLRTFYNEVVEQAQGTPGVQAAMVARRIPLALSGGGMETPVTIPGRESEFGPNGVRIKCTDVSPTYFTTLGVALFGGRVFTTQDTYASPRVLVISAALARSFFPGEDPVGKHLRVGDNGGTDAEIVGVVEDVKYNSLTESPKPYIYFPLAQHTSGELTLAVRTLGDPRAVAGALKHRLRAFDSNIFVLEVRTLEDHMDAASYAQRTAAELVASLGLLALVLANIGLYGAISYLVTRRTHEIGVRIALGANPGKVVGLVVGHGLRLAGIGVGIGLPVGVAVMHSLSTLLYGVRPTDPLTLACIVLLLVTVALVSAFIPARRAAKVDPMVALRCE